MRDLKKLKELNRLEDLVEETGYPLDKQAGKRYWHALHDSSLTVDVEKQRFYWDGQAADGDIFAWMMKRFDWDMAKAINFLENRSKLPAGQKSKYPEIKSSLVEDVQIRTFAIPIASEESGGGEEDPRIIEIQKMAFDWPGRIEKLLKLNFLEVLGAREVYPTQFIELVGGGSGDDEFCSFCYRDLQDAEHMYLSVEVGPNFEIRKGKLPGVYCSKCVNNFLRWGRALDRLAAIRGETWAEQPENECDTGAGGESHTLDHILFPEQ